MEGNDRRCVCTVLQRLVVRFPWSLHAIFDLPSMPLVVQYHLALVPRRFDPFTISGRMGIFGMGVEGVFRVGRAERVLALSQPKGQVPNRWDFEFRRVSWTLPYQAFYFRPLGKEDQHASSMRLTVYVST